MTDPTPADELAAWLKEKDYTLMVNPGFNHVGQGQFTTTFTANCVKTPVPVPKDSAPVVEAAAEEKKAE